MTGRLRKTPASPATFNRTKKASVGARNTTCPTGRSNRARIRSTNRYPMIVAIPNATKEMRSRTRSSSKCSTIVIGRSSNVPPSGQEFFFWDGAGLSSSLSASCTAPRNSRSEERRVGKEWRSLCDWSSDVCSSDLLNKQIPDDRRDPKRDQRNEEPHPQLLQMFDDRHRAVFQRPTLGSGVLLLGRRRLVQFALGLVHGPPEFSNRPSQRTTDPRQPLGTEDDQRHEENDDQFRPSDIRHASPRDSIIHLPPTGHRAGAAAPTTPPPAARPARQRPTPAPRAGAPPAPSTHRRGGGATADGSPTAGAAPSDPPQSPRAVARCAGRQPHASSSLPLQGPADEPPVLAQTGKEGERPPAQPQACHEQQHGRDG